MFPDQQNPGSANQAPQQNAQGQYEVVPPLPTLNNVGHSGHNPYEFIVSPNATKPKRNLFGGGSSLAVRIAIVGVGLVVVLIIVASIISALGPKSITPGLTSIAQQQQEITRVAETASLQATSQDTKNFVASVDLSVTSNQEQILAYLQTHGTKMNTKMLAVRHSSQTDTLLANAATAGTYDRTVTQNLTSQLEAYEQSLQTNYKLAHTVAAKQLLQNCYNTATQLVKHAPSINN